MSKNKIIWWSMLACGIGGTLMFGLLCAVLEPPGASEWRAYFWPAITIAVSVTSAIFLRIAYREEPEFRSGFWQISITDLMIATLSTGVLLAISKSVFPEKFLQVGVPLSFFTGLHLLAGMLFATRRGIAKRASKYTFAFGFVMRNYGALFVGAVPVLLIVIIVFHDFSRCVSFLLTICTFEDARHEWFIFYPIRAGIVLFPLGLVLCSSAIKAAAPSKLAENPSS